MTDPRERAESWTGLPEAVQLAEGEVLHGYVVDIRVITGNWGYGEQAVPVLIVESEDGERRALWCFHHVLHQEVKEAGLGRGEEVAVKRGPDREGQQGEYRTYGVFTGGEKSAEVENTAELPDAPDPQADTPAAQAAADEL